MIVVIDRYYNVFSLIDMIQTSDLQPLCYYYNYLIYEENFITLF